MQHKTSIRVIVVYLISTFVCLFLILDPRLCYICHHFSAPKTKAQVQYCDHALSVVRPSSLTFHIFDFSSESAERNSTKLDRKQDLIVYCRACFFFRVDQKKTRWPPWPIRQKGGTLYSGERYMALWAPCFILDLFIM